MDADLIGYLCIGPQKISNRRFLKAVETARETLMELKSWRDGGEMPEYLEDYGNGIDDVKQLKSYIDINADPYDIVNEIVKFWENWNSRDCASRLLNKKEQIIFAGEMTWGDEPDGVGYKCLKRMFILGIDKELGIR